MGPVQSFEVREPSANRFGVRAYRVYRARRVYRV